MESIFRVSHILPIYLSLLNGALGMLTCSSVLLALGFEVLAYSLDFSYLRPRCAS